MSTSLTNHLNSIGILYDAANTSTSLAVNTQTKVNSYTVPADGIYIAIFSQYLNVTTTRLNLTLVAGSYTKQSCTKSSGGCATMDIVEVMSLTKGTVIYGYLTSTQAEITNNSDGKISYLKVIRIA